MKNLERNIKQYMSLKNIRSNSELLRRIANELGEKNPDEFVKKEKHNFSKMLYGERPLKRDFIIPLEKIFGVSLARLLDEDAYKLPVEKANVPLCKSIRDYVYLDDPQRYRNEFDFLLTANGYPVIEQHDEFGKSFLDYVVEYHAVNAVRFLHENYHIKWYLHYNNFRYQKDSRTGLLGCHNGVEFAKLVADMDDVALFYDIFDHYDRFLSNGHLAGADDTFCEIVLDHDALFRSLFEVKPYEYHLDRKTAQKTGFESFIYQSLNPLINPCLRYALKHLDKYRPKAIEILKFGIEHNTKLKQKYGSKQYCIVDEFGGMANSAKLPAEPFEINDLAILVDCEVDDVELTALIRQLPEFPKAYQVTP